MNYEKQRKEFMQAVTVPEEIVWNNDLIHWEPITKYLGHPEYEERANVIHAMWCGWVLRAKNS